MVAAEQDEVQSEIPTSHEVRELRLSSLALMACDYQQNLGKI